MLAAINPTRGSVLIFLFASIAMVAVLGSAVMHIMNGPVRTMSEVTRRTIAENSILGTAKLAMVTAVQTPGDCDGDGMIEPPEWEDAAGRVAPAGGGIAPSSIGAAMKDPWGNAYGYCAWDHGTILKDGKCGGASSRRLEGGGGPGKPVIAVLSAGRDQTYQTSCHGEGGGDYIHKTSGSDDIVLIYNFADAMIASGGLWNLEKDDAGTASIGKNLSVTDSAGTEQFSFDAASKELAVGQGGTGRLPNIKTDYIQNLSENVPVEFLANLSATGSLTVQGETQLKTLASEKATISTDIANAAAAIVTASGSGGVGLKASGEKAIEAAGVIDMMMHKIINLAAPFADQDAATKKYVDETLNGVSRSGQIQCETFTGSGCSGGTPVTLTATSLGACKKACETAGVQCCLATFPLLGNNPNAALGACTGYSAPSQVTGSRNLLAVLGSITAYCYRQY